MTRKLFPPALALLAACASAPVAPPPPVAQREPEAQKPPPPFDPVTWVAGQELAPDCEEAATRIARKQPDDGWQALRACIERGRFARGPFTHLSLLINHWGEDLRARPDAPALVARLIAMRGGDVTGDLARLQKVRTPVFTLAAALQQPAVYRGRYVLIRGRPGEVKMEGEKATVMLTETTVRAVETIKDAHTYKTSSSSSGYGTGQGTAQGTYNGRSGSLSASASGSYSRSSSYSTTYGRRGFENDSAETGRSALGRLPEADPFLEPTKEFLFLARFDGARQTDDGASVALLTIVAYFHPNPLMVD